MSETAPRSPILLALRALTQVSGICEALRKKLKEKPDATLNDFKPDPDGWAQEDEQQRRK
jgi:hypothetical protein